MYLFLLELLRGLLPAKAAALSAYILTLAAMALICIFVRWIVRTVTVRLMSRVTMHAKLQWNNILFEQKVYHRAASFAIPVVMSQFAVNLPFYGNLLERAAQIAGVIVFVRVFAALLTAADGIYNLYEVSKTRPIHSLLQVIQVATYIVSAVVVIALLAGESPLVLLGGIGAATAVTSFIFKDAILGFVAGVQLTGNDMIRIGDWIEMSKYLADGTVVDLSMTTVKVRNFDNTITSIPAYALVSEAFINWRGMESAGGRRIKRAIHIDAAGVRLCDDALIARFRKMALLSGYIDNKLAEIDRYNREHHVDANDPAGGRQITNIGTLRAYILAYLTRHPGIHRDMTTMVRQLAPDDRGIPLEIYTFTSTTAWKEYENIQADIFDHIYSIVGEFGLRIYQRPSSDDLRCLGSTNP